MAKGIKTGGRSRGTPNKNTLSLLDKCRKLNIDPFEELLAFAGTGGANGDEGLRFQALKEVAQYLYPRRKAVEISGNYSPETLEASEQVADMSKDEQIKLLEQQLKALKDA